MDYLKAAKLLMQSQNQRRLWIYVSTPVSVPNISSLLLLLRTIDLLAIRLLHLDWYLRAKYALFIHYLMCNMPHELQQHADIPKPV